MPLHEYRCEPCDALFETLLRSDHDQPRCPTCGGTTLTRQLSVPAAAQMASGRRDLPVCGMPAGGGCGAGACGMGGCGMG